MTVALGLTGDEKVKDEADCDGGGIIFVKIILGGRNSTTPRKD